MKIKLPSLLALMVLAAIAGLTYRTMSWASWVDQEKLTTIPPPSLSRDAFSSPLQSSASAQVLMESAVRAAISRRSISGSLRLRTDLFGRTVTGTGTYRELRQARIPLMRLEINSQVDECMATRRVVGDGIFLWTYQSVLGTQQLVRIDSQKATLALEQINTVQRQLEKAAILPGLGGLERLLRGLEGNFEFDSAESVVWEGVSCWRLLGEWRPQQLARLLPDQKPAIDQGKPVNMEKLPPQLPDQIVLFLGKRDLFPYRIAYCRRPVKKRKLADLAAPPPTLLTLMVLEFFNVDLSNPPPGNVFIYQPGNLPVIDGTEDFIKALH